MTDIRTILRKILPWLLVALVFVPFIWQTALYWCYTNDDAYITFRYSRNLVSGVGPYFNAGEHVEGYTNPLQMFQTALVILAAGPDAAPGIAKGISVLYAAGCVLLTFFLFRGVFPAGPGLTAPLAFAGAVLAAAVVGVSPSFAVNGTSGLETSMFCFFLLAGMALGLRETDRGRWYGSGIAFALAMLARPEGVAVFAVWWTVQAAMFAGGRWREKRSGARKTVFGGIKEAPVARILAVNALVVAAVFLAHLAFRYVMYDGELLPNTYYAKAGGFWKIGAGMYVFSGLVAPVLGIVGVVAAVAGYAAARRVVSVRIAGVAAVAVSGGMLPFALGTDWMMGYRMLVPYLPATVVVVAGGWMLLVSRMKRVPPAALAAGAALIALALWVTQDSSRKAIGLQTRTWAHGYETGHRELARWIRENTAPGDGIALMDIGIVGYECIDHPVIDISGLTDRFIAKSPGPFLHKQYDPAYILGREPRYIVIALYADGTPYTVPPEGTVFQTWTRAEERLFKHPGFQRDYMRSVPVFMPDGDWHAVLASLIGAGKVFEHAHINLYYLLAVYERKGW